MKISPRERLAEFGRTYPGIWRIVDEARQARRPDDPTWPEYVFLPYMKAGKVLALWHVEYERPVDPSTLCGPAFILAGLAAWRATQGIYRYDPALYGPVIETPITGDIPGELLRRLPEWCVYVETPHMTAPLAGSEAPLLGVWAWLNLGKTDSLTLMLHVEGAEQLPVGYLPMVGTLDEALAQVDADWQEAIARGKSGDRLGGPAMDLRVLLADGDVARNYTNPARRAFEPILSLLLYLCSERPDIDGRPVKPVPKRTKLGWRFFPADKPRTWNVGERVGAALRLGYEQQETGRGQIDRHTGHARPRGHIRGAHWHTFLTGEGRQQRRLRWLPPIQVNLPDINALPATVRRVQ